MNTKHLVMALALSVLSMSAPAFASEDESTSVGEDQTSVVTEDLSSVLDGTYAARRIVRGEGCTPEGAYIQWACGGRPAGRGWVRVDRNCWHRDTGRRCY